MLAWDDHRQNPANPRVVMRPRAPVGARKERVEHAHGTWKARVVVGDDERARSFAVEFDMRRGNVEPIPSDARARV